MTALQRRARADAADAACAAAFAGAVARHTGLALVAVGGYGRGELAPHSDLDLVLVHTESVQEDRVAAIAQRLWYPLWEAGPTIDHAVRALQDVTGAARGDVRVALGLLDARHLAGDPAVTLQLRTTVSADWRRHARQRLPRLRELVSRRGDRAGELARAAVPDVKDSLGGLRDTTVLTALVASWLVDVPHTELRWCRRQLLDLRDVLHEAAGRRTDRIAPELWDELAARLGLSGPVAAQAQVRELGCRVTHLSRLTWRRVDAVLDRPEPRPRPPSGT